MADRIDWNAVPEVELVLVRQPKAACPQCGSTEHRFVRSIHGHGDGSATRYKICDSCSQPFRLLAYFDDDDE